MTKKKRRGRSRRVPRRRPSEPDPQQDRPEPGRRPNRWFSVLPWLITTGAVAMTIVLWLPAMSGDKIFDSSYGGRLVAVPDSIDLGQVPLGRWVAASFTLENAGTERLRFTREPWVEAVKGC